MGPEQAAGLADGRGAAVSLQAAGHGPGSLQGYAAESEVPSSWVPKYSVNAAAVSTPACSCQVACASNQKLQVVVCAAACAVMCEAGPAVAHAHGRQSGCMGESLQCTYPNISGALDCWERWNKLLAGWGSRSADHQRQRIAQDPCKLGPSSMAGGRLVFPGRPASPIRCSGLIPLYMSRSPPPVGAAPRTAFSALWMRMYGTNWQCSAAAKQA
jgi:hypothetical protein